MSNTITTDIFRVEGKRKNRFEFSMHEILYTQGVAVNGVEEVERRLLKMNGEDVIDYDVITSRNGGVITIYAQPK